MAYRYDFTRALERSLFLGTDVTLKFPVYSMEDISETQLAALIAAGTATPVDVSGWTMRFSIKRKAKDDEPGLIEKATGGDGITVTGSYNVSQASNTQRVAVALADTDTYDEDSSPAVDFNPGKYQYALKRMDAGSETIIAYGDLELVQAATHE